MSASLAFSTHSLAAASGIVHHLVDQLTLGLVGADHLAFEQVGRRAHRAQLAHEPRGAARAGEDADHDLRQADPGLGIVGAEDAVRGQRQFQPDAGGGSGQGGRDRLAALLGLGVHAGQLDLPQEAVHLHDPLEETLGRFVASIRLHLGKQIEVHAAGEAVRLAGGDHDALHRLIRQRVVDGRLQFAQPVEPHHVHRLVRNVPGDDGDAIVAFGQCEFAHVFVLF